MKYFLGLQIARADKGIILSQLHYTLQILEDIGFLACKPAPIPMDPKIKLNAIDSDVLPDVSQYPHWSPSLPPSIETRHYFRCSQTQPICCSATNPTSSGNSSSIKIPKG